MTGMGKVADPPHTKVVLRDFGKRLRKWRELGGMSRTMLAARLGMENEGRIATYERGQSSMPYHYLLKLSDVSGFTLDYWLRGPARGARE